MASVTINNSPFHEDSIITYPYGVIDSGYSCGVHVGVDIVANSGTGANIYPVFAGQVVAVNTNPNNALGVYVQILDNFGYYWRYCHMLTGSTRVNVGDNVTTNDIIGQMDSTGNVTGPHLHLECSTTQAWQCATFVNPCERIGIPNEDDLIIHYDGSPTPPTPSFDVKKNKFPWAIISRKLRNKRNGKN